MCDVYLYDQGQVVQYQTDLPPIVPIITQFNIETGRCPCCRQFWQGRHPDQTSDAIGATGNTLGPVVLTMAAEMKHRLGVSYGKICDFLQTYCQLRVCPGAFIRAEQRLAALAKPTYELLIEALRQSHVVHADETGWRVGRLSAGCGSSAANKPPSMSSAPARVPADMAWRKTSSVPTSTAISSSMD